MNEAELQFSAAASLQATNSQGGLSFSRRFSTEGVSPYDEVQWEKRTALITDSKGNTIFEQKDVDVPIDWSMTATNIVASKYFHGTLGTPERESSVRQLIGRVATTIHRGAYSGLEAAHVAIRAWCAAREHMLTGTRWEIYGDWHEDPEQLETEINYLLR